MLKSLGLRDNPFDRNPSRRLGQAPRTIACYDLAPERVFVTNPRNRAPLATIVFIHGLTDHAARQFSTAHWLASLGYRTLVFDLVGHGGRDLPLDVAWGALDAYSQSDNALAIASTFARQRQSSPQWREIVAEQHNHTLSQTQFSDHLQQMDRVMETLLASRWHAADRPLFVMGHSLGGLISLEATRRWQQRGLPQVNGLILISPAFEPQGPPGDAVQTAAINTLWALRNSTFPSPLALVRPVAKRLLSFNLPLNTAWGLPYTFNDPDEIALVQVDPLVLHTLPSSYVSSIEDQVVQTDRLPTVAAKTLMLLPEEDAIVPVDASLRYARRAVAAQGSTQWTVLQFPHVRVHDLMRSSAREGVRKTIRSWLQRHAAETRQTVPKRMALSAS